MISPEMTTIPYPCEEWDSSFIMGGDRVERTGNRHLYDVHNEEGQCIQQIQFQRGPRNQPDSKRGIYLMHMLAICIDQVEGFQTGEFACDANEAILVHLRAAMLIATERRDARAKAGTLGTWKP